MSTDRETLEAYEAAADQYQTLTRGSEKPELAALIAVLEPGAKVLDLGCGPGSDMERMAAAGLAPVGLDPTMAFVERAQAAGQDVRFGQFDDLDDIDTYDAVWASFSLLHAPREALPGHLTRIHTALKPGGRFVIGMKMGSGEARDSLGRLYTYYSVPDLANALITAGFSLSEIREGMEAGLTGDVEPFVVITALA